MKIFFVPVFVSQLSRRFIACDLVLSFNRMLMWSTGFVRALSEGHAIHHHLCPEVMELLNGDTRIGIITLARLCFGGLWSFRVDIVVLMSNADDQEICSP